MGATFGTCGRESEPSLEEANITLDVQVQNLENRIAKMTRDAQSWASQAASEPTAKMRCMACLKKKKQYELQRDRLLATQSNIESAQFQQEQTQIAYKAAQALRKGHEKMKEQQEKMNVESLENLMDDMQDRQVALRESQEVMARNGAVDGTTDDDFEAEFRAMLTGTEQEMPTQQPACQVVESARKRCPPSQADVATPQRQPNVEKAGPTQERRISKEPEVAPSLLQAQVDDKRKTRNQQAEWERIKMEARAQDWAATALPIHAPRAPLRQPVLA